MNELIPNRRQFTGALLGAAFGSSASAAVADTEAVCRVLDARGEPLALTDRPPFWNNFHCCDFKLRPFPMRPAISGGEVRFPVPGRPFRIAANLTVPGFGHVFAYADNRGRGHTAQTVTGRKPLLLNPEFAADRLATVRALAEDCRRSSIVVPAGIGRRVDQAAALLDKALAAKEERELAAISLDSLAQSLWAGEEIVFERARQRIEKQGFRPGFQFMSTVYWIPEKGKPYADRFEEFFNTASLPFFPIQYEPTEGKIDYHWPDGMLDYFKDKPVMHVGHPLFWFAKDYLPPYLKDLPFDETMKRYSARARRTVLRYRHRVHSWVVVNEGNMWNPADWDANQLTEAVRIALRVTREADPTAYRILNCAMTWNETMYRSQPRGVRPVYDYLAALREARAEYDAIGLEFYFTNRDMLETERSLDLLQEFGHPIFVTEAEVPGTSDSTRPANAPQWFMGAPSSWHGDQWTETTQADWGEQFYTLLYSKPWIQMAGWSGVSDYRISFARGGLVNEDSWPKELFRRLMALRKRWQSMV